MFEKGILLCATKNSAFTIGTQVINILFQMPDIEAIYIVHDGFLERDILTIKSLCKHIYVKFIYLDESRFIEKLKKYSTVSSNLGSYDVWSRYTHMTFGRFEALNLLDECKKIIYIDFDMVLNASISELFLLSKPLAMTRASASLEYGLGFTIDGIDCSVSNYGAPIILFTNKIHNFVEIYRKIYEFTAMHFEKLSHGKLLDQAVFTAIILKNDIEVEILDSDIYNGNCSWKKCDSAKVFHAFGKFNRFWNNKLTAITRPEFFVYYNKWLEFGGSPYEGDWAAYLDVPNRGGELYAFFQNFSIAKIAYQALNKYFYISSDLNFKNNVQMALFGAGQTSPIMLNIKNINSSSLLIELGNKDFTIKFQQTINRSNLEKDIIAFINKHYFFVCD